MKAAPKALPHRVCWQVIALPGIVGWAVIRDQSEVSRSFFKFRAVNFAAKQCNFEWAEQGIRSELLIHGRNGRFQDARTYGADPPRIKG